MKKVKLKDIAIIALLIAMEVILTRFLSIQTPVVRIGFGFLPIVIVAMLYGPVYAGAAAAMADLLGAMLFPIGPYFPGFTFTAFLIGAVYGLFLYKRNPDKDVVKDTAEGAAEGTTGSTNDGTVGKDKKGLLRDLIRIGIAVLIVTVVLQLFLDTLWISIITGSEYIVWLPLRAIRTAFMLPIQIILISLVMASKQLFPAVESKSAS